MVSLSFSFVRRRTWIPAGFFRVRWSTRSPSPSPSTALTAFWSCGTSSRVYISLQVCRTLQHCSIQLMLLFLGFNQASHGGCNIWQCLLESPSIRLNVIISILGILSHGIFCSLVRILSIIPIMGSHNWTTTYLPATLPGLLPWKVTMTLQCVSNTLLDT